MAKIPENVLNVLGECRADGNLLYLPSVQLDRKTYTEVNKVLENMGGKWNRKTKAHVFAEDDDVAEMLEKDRKSTRLNSSHPLSSRMPSSA